MTAYLRAARVVAYALIGAFGTAATTPTPAPAPRKPLPIHSPTPTCTPTTLKVLTVGDSITAGVTMTADEGPAYRAELGQLLDNACVEITFTVDGWSGKPCGWWADRIADLVATHRPDVLLLNCGTNDNLLGATPSAVASWEAMYRGLIDDALAADQDVIVYPALVQYSKRLTDQDKARCLAMDGAYASDLLPQREEAANAAITRAVTLGGRVPAFIDYQPVGEHYLDQCGVHPTRGGYDVMGRIAYTVLAQRRGWPAVTVPCGLDGHPPGGTPRMYEPCEQMGVNP